MNKLDVGMYVRTKWGIAKYIKNLATNITIYRMIDKKIIFENIEGYENLLLDNEIQKASYNIIDLIEVGDYVNGWRVNRVEKEEDGTFLTVGTLTSFVSRNEKDPYLTEDYNEADKICKIKSIVTKEQFESMSYKIGD